jgi:hypothetical protein
MASRPAFTPARALKRASPLRPSTQPLRPQGFAAPPPRAARAKDEPVARESRTAVVPSAAGVGAGGDADPTAAFLLQQLLAAQLALQPQQGACPFGGLGFPHCVCQQCVTVAAAGAQLQWPINGWPLAAAQHSPLADIATQFPVPLMPGASSAPPASWVDLSAASPATTFTSPAASAAAAAPPPAAAQRQESRPGDAATAQPSQPREKRESSLDTDSEELDRHPPVSPDA